jgi:hypothetical protein
MDKTRLQPLHRFSFGGTFRHVLQPAPLITMTGVLNSSGIDILSCMKRLYLEEGVVVCHFC